MLDPLKRVVENRHRHNIINIENLCRVGMTNIKNQDTAAEKSRIHLKVSSVTYKFNSVLTQTVTFLHLHFWYTPPNGFVCFFVELCRIYGKLKVETFLKGYVMVAFFGLLECCYNWTFREDQIYFEWCFFNFNLLQLIRSTTYCIS